MIKCITVRKMFVKALYNELNKEEKENFESHLKNCEKCAGEYAEMSFTVERMNYRELPEPEENFWNNYWLKISGRINEQTKPAPVLNNIIDSIINILVFRPGLVVYPLASVLLITIGLFLGKIIFSPDTGNLSKNSIKQKSYNQILLENRISDYLDRSKVILSSIDNFDITEDDIYTLDIPEQKKISLELIGESLYLKSDLINREQDQLFELITDLKMILLKIAALNEKVSEYEINLIQTAIKSSALLLKINLEQIKRSSIDRIKDTGQELTGKNSNS